MNDDDRIAIILNEQPEVSMAVRDELMDFERCIEDVQENLYVVSPRAPVCEIFPRPLYGEASQAVRGVNRRFSTNPINMWRPAVLPATLTLRWDQEFAAGELRMTFDTLTRAAHEMPFECNERASGMLARHYLVELFSKGNSTARIEITDNYNRLNILNFHGAVCDEMRLTLMETWKESCLPGVYDIRLYSNQG